MSHKKVSTVLPVVVELRFLTAAELAPLLRVSRRTIRRMVARREIPFVRTRGKSLFPVTGVEQFIAKRTVAA